MKFEAPIKADATFVSTMTNGVKENSDRILLHGVAGGSAEAMSALYDRWFGSVAQAVDIFVGAGADSDRVIEQVFDRITFEAAVLAASREPFGRVIGRITRQCTRAVVARKYAEQVDPDTSALPAPSPALLRFRSILDTDGVGEAIRYLNSLTPFRFTGIYRFDGLQLANLFLFDRDDARNGSGGSSAVADTYCVWVQETLSVIQMADSRTDPRAIAHSKREKVRSYCGGPLRNAEGRLFGTICHFDFLPHDVPAGTMGLLETVAPELSPLVCSPVDA